MRCSPSANNSFLQTFEFLGRQLIASLTPPCQTFSEKGDLASNSRLLGFSCRHPLRPGSNLRGVCACQTDSHFTSYLTEWSASFGPPPDRQQTVFLRGTNLEFWRIVPLSKLLWSISRMQMAYYLAVVAPHSGDWLLALPIANCGPDSRLEDEAVRVAPVLPRQCWHAARTDSVCPHKCPRLP